MEFPRIVIAGASGYIGKTLIPYLLEKFPEAQIIALSRSQQKSEDPRVIWKACDLFSLKSVEEALPPTVDLALYLVHSMGPTAHLDQGSFADYDLILADNFARTLKKTNIQHLIYLGGLIPPVDRLSLHLQSRLEVEETFVQYGLPTTFFRAGLILGESGSSFQILLKLVKRLPFMICPRWTLHLTTPVDLETVMQAMTVSALNSDHYGKIYDLAGCPPLTYFQILKETAEYLGKKRYFITVPVFSAKLSRIWVSLVTKTPKNLVYPLIQSLEHEMVARPDHLFSDEWRHRSYKDLLKRTSMKTKSSSSLFRFKVQRRSVRSVQRLPLPPEKDAIWVKDQYVRWLPKFLNPFMKVKIDGATIVFAIFTEKFVLLELNFSEIRSNPDRQLLYIKGGLLVADENRGRLEFRVALNRRYILAAIHDYRPYLPWYIYRYTQAIVHLLVMQSFGRYLQRNFISVKVQK